MLYCYQLNIQPGYSGSNALPRTSVIIRRPPDTIRQFFVKKGEKMEVIGTLGIILFMAFLVESLVEYFFGEIANHVPALEQWKWLLMYVAAAVGIVAAFIYQFDLISLIASWLEVELNASPFGIVLTGLAIGRGANYIHQIISTYFPKK